MEGLAVDPMHRTVLVTVITLLRLRPVVPGILVPQHRIELRIDDYKSTVIPFNYKGEILLKCFYHFKLAYV